MSRFYITTTLPYVNGKPHIGFALEVVQADVIARFHAALGEEVVLISERMNMGRRFGKSEREGVTPQEFCDRMSEHFRNLKTLLDIGYTNFIPDNGWVSCEGGAGVLETVRSARRYLQKELSGEVLCGCELGRRIRIW